MAKAVNGDDVRVNAATIEKRLADIWREEQEEERAVTRAALWNVVAHTWTSEAHARATEVLARASATVPQRTIVIRAEPGGRPELSSWISANCHIVGGGRQVCSEEVNIVAAGERVHHVPPLVHSLLLPDMPVALWWVGDLPNDHRDYARELLDPADRLIVDSAHFDGVADFELVLRIAQQTITAPADLNWVRLEEWRAATAALFDPPAMRARLRAIRSIHVACGAGSTFGELAEALLYVAWIAAQTESDILFDFSADRGAAGIDAAEIRFDDGTKALIRRDPERGIVAARADGIEAAVDCIARALAREPDDLIVRLLQRPEADHVYLKTLRAALPLAARIA